MFSESRELANNFERKNKQTRMQIAMILWVFEYITLMSSDPEQSHSSTNKCDLNCFLTEFYFRHKYYTDLPNVDIVKKNLQLNVILHILFEKITLERKKTILESEWSRALQIKLFYNVFQRRWIHRKQILKIQRSF